MKYAVLGCGPAGLMAVHAIRLAVGPSADIRVFSKKRKSMLAGAQYLHQPIPYVTEGEPILIDYRLTGSVEKYRRKVYGGMWDGKVSPDELEHPHEGWDLRSTYDRLWEMYEELVIDSHVDPAAVQYLVEDDGAHTINTIPLDALCPRGHTFGYTEIIAAGDAPDLGVSIPYQCPPNTVQCNGEESPSWYRLSNIFDHKTVEWPRKIGRVPIPSATVRKPTFNNCTCWRETDVLCVGRYGAWTKGVLTHDAFNAVVRALA